MNNTLFYVLKWIYSQSSYHWYVRRFKYVWHKETMELTDGWFCWYRSWRGNLSTVNWQITEIKDRSITSLAWFRQKTHSSTGLPAALSHPICVKKRQTEQSEAVGSTHARVNLRTAYAAKGQKRWLGCFSAEVHAGKDGLVPLLRPTSLQGRVFKRKTATQLLAGWRRS